MISWLRHPLEAFKWWWYDFNAPDWRTRLMHPFLKETHDLESADRREHDEISSLLLRADSRVVRVPEELVEDVLLDWCCNDNDQRDLDEVAEYHRIPMEEFTRLMNTEKGWLWWVDGLAKRRLK